MRAPEFAETGGGFRVTLHAELDQPLVEPAPAAPESGGLGGVYNRMSINPRQEAALMHLHKGNPRITNSDLQELCPDVHPETIRRDLADLVAKNVLRKLGQKRGSYYVLNADKDSQTES
jgi:ATP-dependent DNA helicase RecG